MNEEKYPKSPSEEVGGMRYFARMLDKIRLYARGELSADYHANLGKQEAADGTCCNFLRVSYDKLRDRVLEGGSDEEILEWCYSNGRRLNAGDLIVWNAFLSKLGWNDFASARLKTVKDGLGIADRSDINTIPEVMDFEEGRRT
jgi:gluconokinase